MHDTGADVGTTADLASDTTLGTALRVVAERRPDDVAFLDPVGGDAGRAGDGWRRTTWRTVAETVDWLAAGLLEAGVRAGDSVLVLSELSRNALLADLAAQSVGAEVVTLPTKASDEALGRVLRDRSPVMAFGQDPATAQRLVRGGLSPERAVNLDEDAPDPTTMAWLVLLDHGLQALNLDPDLVSRRLAELTPETPSSVLHIGGSVRYPVHATHAAWTAQARTLADVGVVQPDDVVLTWLRLHEPWTRALLAAQVRTGAALALATPRLAASAPAAAFAAVRPTVILGPKTGFAGLPAQLLDHRVRGKAWSRHPAKALAAAHEVRDAERRGARPSAAAVRRAAPVAALADFFGGRLRLVVCDGDVPAEAARLLDAIGLPAVGSLSTAVSSGPAAIDDPRAPHAGSVGLVLPGLELRVEHDGTLAGRGDVVGEPRGEDALPPPGGWQRFEVLGDVDREQRVTVGTAGRARTRPTPAATRPRNGTARPTGRPVEEPAPVEEPGPVAATGVVPEAAAPEQVVELDEVVEPEPDEDRVPDEGPEPEEQPPGPPPRIPAAELPEIDTTGMSALDALLARRAAAAAAGVRSTQATRRAEGTTPSAPRPAAEETSTPTTSDSTPASSLVLRAVPVGTGPGNGPAAEKAELTFQRVCQAGARLVLDADRPVALVVPDPEALVAWGRSQHLPNPTAEAVAADEEFHALVEACLMSLGGRVTAFAILDHDLPRGHRSREAVRADHHVLLGQLDGSQLPTTTVVTGDPYAVLEVAYDADPTTLRSAYRRLVRTVHPDVNPDPAARERFEALTAAYSVLSDPEKRHQVDLSADELARFRARRPAPRHRSHHGYDVTVAITIGTAEAARGGAQPVVVERLLPCPDCGATGCTEATQVVACSGCAGSGHVEHVQHTFAGDVRTWRRCRECHGVGTVLVAPCGTCAGEGRVPGESVLTVALPERVANEARLFVAGEGDAGEAGGPPGDLYLQVTVTDAPVGV